MTYSMLVFFFLMETIKQQKSLFAHNFCVFEVLLVICRTCFTVLGGLVDTFLNFLFLSTRFILVWQLALKAVSCPSYYLDNLLFLGGFYFAQRMSNLHHSWVVSDVQYLKNIPFSLKYSHLC